MAAGQLVEMDTAQMFENEAGHLFEIRAVNWFDM